MPEDEGKISEFNAAALKMKRLDKLEGTMNDISVNLFAFDADEGVFNFEKKFANCNQLYQEVESKLTEKERIKGTALRKAVQRIIQKYPVFTKIRNKNKNTKIDPVAKQLITDWLFKYETLI